MLAWSVLASTPRGDEIQIVVDRPDALPGSEFLDCDRRSGAVDITRGINEGGHLTGLAVPAEATVIHRVQQALPGLHLCDLLALVATVVREPLLRDGGRGATNQQCCKKNKHHSHFFGLEFAQK